MKWSVSKTLSVAMLVFMMAACSDDGDSSGSLPSTGTGHYVDSAVEGVNYTCSTHTGLTGSEGEFTYELNRECTFSIGNTVLRKVLKGDLDTDMFTVIENNITVARLLQTLDNDGNASNGIRITENMRNAFKENNIANVRDIDAIYNAISNTEGYQGHLVTEAQANEHLQETLKTMLAGKTFYGVTEPGGTFLGMPVTTNDTGYVIPFSFNSDLTMINEGTSDATSIRFDGTKLIYTSDNNGSYQLIEGKTEKYIKVTTVYAVGSGTIGHMRLYYNQTDAQAYADAINSSTSGDTTGGSTDGYTTASTIPDRADGLIIYNNISSVEADSAAAEIHTANNDYNRRYNSDATLYCNNYGYTYLLVDNTDPDTGVQTKSYSVSQNDISMCLEHYYSSGSKAMALYKQ